MSIKYSQDSLRRFTLGLALVCCAGFANAADVATIKSRSDQDAYNDMVRNWGAPAGGSKNAVAARSNDAAYIDMVRNWGAAAKSEDKPMVASPDDANRHDELVRASFPLNKGR